MTTTTNKKIAYMTMGLPGSGKSTAIQQIGLAHVERVDPDEIKASHSDYDPKNPNALHKWSKQMADAKMAGLIAAGKNMVIDGTGTNAEAMVQKIVTLQAAGYHVKIIYVNVTLATALARNAARERVVPEHIIREKAELISTAADIVARYADSMEVINND